MSTSKNFSTIAGAMKGRQEAISQATDQEVRSIFPVNNLATDLHPVTQHLKIEKVIDRGPDARSFVLVPDKEKGTKQLAYFQAGQYLSVRFHIGKSYCTRPYAISSSPKQALNGKYMLTIKSVKNGFVTPYIWQNWKEGTEVTAAAPAGRLFYEPVRDKQNIIAIAGGSGITPFYAMAAAIADDTIDANLVILYGSRTHDHILLRNQLKKIAKQTNKVKVVNVLSDEKVNGYEHGFIGEDLIRKYAPTDGNYSIFMSGPGAMIHFANQAIKKLDLPRGRVRQEFSGTVNPYVFPNYPAEAKGKTFKMTVKTRDQNTVIPARSDESLLVAMERAGIIAPSSCRSGICGACRSRVIKGKAFVPFPGRRKADEEYNFVHTCVSFPVEDLTLEVPVHDFANSLA